MKRREGKIPIPLLISITLVTILLMFFELNSKHRVKAEFFEEKIAAAELTQRCFDEIKQASDNLNIPIDRINDPIYYEYKYSVTQAVISLVILVLIIFVVLRFDIEHYFMKKKK